MTREAIFRGYTLVIAAIGGAFVTVFGSWSTALTILCVCMAIDYLSGFVVAGLFHASPKSEGGGLDSRAGWKGLVRKGATLGVVLIAHFVDYLLHTEYIRDAVVIAFIVNEMLSILENFALMGVPIPQILLRSIDIIKQKNDQKEDNLTWDEYQRMKEKDPTHYDDLKEGKITFISNEGSDDNE